MGHSMIDYVNTQKNQNIKTKPCTHIMVYTLYDGWDPLIYGIANEVTRLSRLSLLTPITAPVGRKISGAMDDM